ncbi:MAG: hypothetical protein AVDCRST_MAG74-2149 [uncultured Pyrinomonadaceae bacterium]|uniref:Uncharacterized protein n=1 Tax=uncultured Pyrinomonadaceae bacterium TaxID=2283094 RepID=A0A6J4PAM2_9BACT|nr:MAG: hypothetical protein AVDCRST_MAG74-2149 [uncultured Pyrinomonadaceae bacterium]
MKRLFFIISAIVLSGNFAFAQKGIDPQTKKIQEEGVKITGTQRSNEPPSRSFDFGKDKTKVREPLANPYRMASRRDVLVENVLEVLKERKLLVNEAASRKGDGIIVTEPLVFAKGAVISRNELNRYAVLPNSDTSWTRGRYTLTIEIQSIDGIQNNVSVTAKVEGRSENGLQSEWTTLSSTGAAEDEFLVKLVEMVTGTLIDAPQDTDQ